MRYGPLLILPFLSVASLWSQETQPEPEIPKVVVRPEIPSPEIALEAMKRATFFYRTQVSVAGGYAWEWPADRSVSHGENRESPSLIMIQPPGTPSMGLAMLEAWKATGDPLFLQGAKEAAHCLAWIQLSSGGWPADFDFNPLVASRWHYRRDLAAGDTDPGKRSARSSLDDNKTQSALLFLLEFAQTEPGKADAQLQETLKFGMDGLLAAQFPNGGWPQQYSGPADPEAPIIKASYAEEWSREFPHQDYTGYYTLNDGNLYQVARLLVRAHELTGEDRYMESLKKLGEFHKLAQFPEPQAIWAQQYDHEMHAAWARKFEPPSVSSLESFAAMKTLAEIWLATGDKDWLEPIPRALKWFQANQLPDKRWARFYELQTNQPLYCVADTYEITYDDSNVPTHYGFKSQPDLAEQLERFEDFVKRDRKEILAAQQDPATAEDWAVKARRMRKGIWGAVDELDSKGRWMEGDRISARLYVKNMRELSTFVDAANKGGEEFQEMLQKSIREAEKEAAKKAEEAAKKAAEQGALQ